MLSIQNLHAYYGKSHVLHGVSFGVGQGEIVALLGRNGSGRSTTAKAIMGLVDCQGSIDWQGQPIQGKKAYEVAHLGIGYVPENRDIFPKLTVHQNLLLGQKSGAGFYRYQADPAGKPVKQAAVLGAGIMGAGIAQVAAQAGHTVRLYDTRAGAAAAAIAGVASLGGDGGLISVDTGGNGGWCFNSQGMYRGIARADRHHQERRHHRDRLGPRPDPRRGGGGARRAGQGQGVA